MVFGLGCVFWFSRLFIVCLSSVNRVSVHLIISSVSIIISLQSISSFSFKESSFEESLTARSAEFEAERLRRDDVNTNQVVVIPDEIAESGATDTNKVEPEGNVESKAAGKGKDAKSKVRHESYEEEYYERHDGEAGDYEQEGTGKGKAAGKGKKGKARAPL